MGVYMWRRALGKPVWIPSCPESPIGFDNGNHHNQSEADNRLLEVMDIEPGAACHPQHRGADLGLGPIAGGAAASSSSSRLSAAEAFLRASQGGDRRGLAGRQLGRAFDRPESPARSPSELLSADFPSPADLWTWDPVSGTGVNNLRDCAHMIFCVYADA